MLKIEVPGWKKLEIGNLVMDLNGTIAVNGKVSDKVAKRVCLLNPELNIVVLTADTLGRLEEIKKRLRVEVVKIEQGKEKIQKREYVRKLGGSKTVAIGNGANDELMLAEAAVGIAVLEGEGLACEVIAAADVLVRDAAAALDLLINPTRLVATLRR